MNREQCLAATLSIAGEQEEVVERQRQQLAQSPNFEPYAAFQRIDVEGTGDLDAFDFYRFLRQRIGDVTELDTALIVNFFDSNSDGKLTYGDFLSLILPCGDQELRAEVTQRENYKATQITPAIEMQLVELLDSEIGLQREVEEQKLKLVELADFDSANLFDEMLRYSGQTKTVDRRGLELFLCAKGYTPEQGTLSSILRRVDLDADLQISEGELKNFLEPLLDKKDEMPPSPEFNEPVAEPMPEEPRSPQGPVSNGSDAAPNALNESLNPNDELVIKIRHQLKSLRDRECTLCDLCCIKDFSLARGFSVVDKRGLGSVYPEELFESLIAFLPDFKMENLALFLARNLSKENYTFEDFVDNFTPIDVGAAELLHSKRSSEHLNKETMDGLRRAWAAQLDLEAKTKEVGDHIFHDKVQEEKVRDIFTNFSSGLEQDICVDLMRDTRGLYPFIKD